MRSSSRCTGLWLSAVLLFTLIYASGCQSEKIIIREKEVTAPANNTVFFDEFDPDNAALRNVWRSNGRAHWVWQGKTSALPGCENGCLKQNSEDVRALNAIMYVATPQISNATIKTKARIKYDRSVSPTREELDRLRKFIGTGIVFRLVDENNYYMFRLAGEEGCVLGKMVNNQWIDLANPRRLNFLEGGRIKPNNWYRLKVKVNGNNIQCFINDSPVINFTDPDPTFTIGHFGLCTFKCFGDFEYIEVTE